MSPTMNFLAAAAANTTALDKLKEIPTAFWLKIGIVVLDKLSS